MEQIKKNIKDTFSALTFKDFGHKYYIEDKPLDKSVSTLIKDFCLPFNEDEKSAFMAKRDGTNQQDLLNAWHEKRDRRIAIGKQSHLFGELYPFNPGLRPQSQYELAIMKFWNSLPDFVVPVLVEQPMYHKSLFYAGTPDGILLNTQTGKLIIIDYKTNEDLFKNFAGQKLLGVFSYLLDTPYNKYQIQLSYYKILLEQTGYEVSTTKIIWIKEDGTFTVYDTDDLTQYLK